MECWVQPVVAHEESMDESEEKKDERMGDRLVVVFDMDHTMVGDLVSLSDRDNIETNIEWTWWPEGHHYGLHVEEIKPYLKRGMLRPGLIEFVEYLKEIGATIVVYTHSEPRWASKVTQAIEDIAGFKFIHRVFSRFALPFSLSFPLRVCARCVHRRRSWKTEQAQT